MFHIGIDISAKEVKSIGALGVYERNLRHANEELLKEGNFSEVPTKDVLDKIKQEYENKYRLDENCYKEVRMFAFITRYSDVHSKEVKGECCYNFTCLIFANI